MATPQDAPTRKKQKARATRKLEQWKKKQEGQGSSPKAAPKKDEKK
jgi:hypothetical protein